MAQAFSCEFYEICKNTFFHRTPLVAASGYFNFYIIRIIVLYPFRGCLHVKFHPGMKLVPRWNHPCLWGNVSYCLHIFPEMKLRPGMNSSLSKRQGWNFIPEWKKKKRRVNASSRDEILKCFFHFWRMYLNILFKVNKLNIIRVWI